jgi:hypothetical protein
MRLQFKNIGDKDSSGLFSRDGSISAIELGFGVIRADNGPREGKESGENIP